MRILFTLATCFIFLNPILSQDIFQKKVGSSGADYLTDMQQQSDGSYIAWGYTIARTADSSYAQLFKVDSTMNVLWTRTFTFNNQMRTTDFSPTSDGGFLICGRTWQTPTAATKQGGFVAKTNATGVIQWTRILKFDGSETVLNAFEEADGNIRVFVRANTTSYYLKLNASGAPTGFAQSPTNGAYDMTARKVVRVAPERYALLGDFLNAPDHILMLNRDTLQWVNEYNGILNEGRINNIATDAAGNIFFVGDYRAGNYDLRQIHVGKLTQTGIIRWTTALPMILNGGRGIDTVWRFSNGNHLQLRGNRLYVSGGMLNEQKQYSYGIISAFDTTLTTASGRNWLWTRQYGNFNGVGDSLARVFVQPNGQLIGAGNTIVGGTSNNPDFYFVKTDTSGVSSCNYGSYTPVEQITGTAYLSIQRFFINMATPLLTLTSFTDAIPTTTARPVGATSTVCSAQLCPPGTVLAAISPLTVCRFDTVTITSSGATSYLWSSTALASARRDSVFRVPMTLDGAFSFNLSAQPRGQNCFAAQTINVVVNPLPIVGLNAPRLMCSGDSLSVNCGAVSGITLTWSSASNSPWRAGSAQTNIVARPVTPGVHTYNVRGVDQRGCVNNNSTTITVRDNVTPSVNFDLIGCPGPDLTLRARGTFEGATPLFDWIIDGSLINGRREVFIPNAIGKQVQVVMSVGGDVCPQPPSTRQVRSPIRTISCIGVSTDEIDNLEKMMVFPNPNDGTFSARFQLETSKKVSFTVRNILGQAIQTVAPRRLDAGEHTQTFELNGVSKGIYLLETRFDDKVVMSKIMVE